MRGEAIGPVKSKCSNVGQFQVRKVEGRLVIRRRRDGIGDFWRGSKERG